MLKFATYTKANYQDGKWTPGTLTNLSMRQKDENDEFDLYVSSRTEQFM